jgi:hypothetical protein
LDGPGHGVDLIQPAKQQALKAFVANDCWQASYPDLLDAGVSANDFFLPSYVKSIAVASSSLGNGNCNGDAVCEKWINRMTADYPHLTGGATRVPILVWYANGDTTVTPDIMQCVYNRLAGDGANLQACYDPSPTGHAGSLADNAAHAVDWIAAQLADGGAPSEPCARLGTNEAGVPQLVDDAGAPVACNPLVPTQ